MSNDNLRLVVLENIEELGNKTNAHLKKKRAVSKNFTIPVDLVRFSNGEGKVKLLDSVRSKNVYILSDIGNYSSNYKNYGKTHYMGPDEHFQDIKRTILAIRGNANKITVIMPLLYSSRQHSRNGRESLDCALALQELESLGVEAIATFDAHDPNVQNAIPLLSFDNFFPTHTILTEFVENEMINYEKLLVVSPDEGAMKRSRYYAGMLSCDIGMFYKRRDYSVVVDGTNPLVEHKYLGKNEENLDYIIVDDMIATGGSIIDILKQLKGKNPHNVFVIATFAMFTTGTEIFDKAYEEGLLTRIYTTNLTYIPEEYRKKPWLKVIDCSELLADVINTYENGESVAELLNGKKAMFALIEKNKNKVTE